MKLLLIHHRMPYPLRSGMDKVTYNLIRIMCEAHDVTLVIPVDHYTDPAAIRHVGGICRGLTPVHVARHALTMQKRHLSYWLRFMQVAVLRRPRLVAENYYPAVARTVKKLMRSNAYDLIQAASLAAASYLPFKKAIRNSTIFHDTGFTLSRDLMNWERRPLSKAMLWLDHLAYLRYETNIYLKCDFSFFLSVRDMQRMQDKVHADKPARHLPLPVQPDDSMESRGVTLAGEQDPNSIVIVGGFGPFFNRDAVEYFCREILPRILRSQPEAKCYVVGENPGPEASRAARYRQVVVVGDVQDVSSYIMRAAVYVAPIRFGGGLKTKLVEAMSLGKAIVATSAAVGGLWDAGYNALCIHDDPAGFADEVVLLLRNDEMRVQLGARARRLFETAYSIKTLRPRVLDAYWEMEKTIREMACCRAQRKLGMSLEAGPGILRD